MRILLLASHQIAEYDDIRMFTRLGHEVFCPGGYQDPTVAAEGGLRPAIPEAPVFPDLIAACERVRAERGAPGDMIDWAKAALPDEVIDWAEVIIAHHFVDRWVAMQWPRIGHKRVVWRTCGQSSPALEALMAQLRPRGLQIVRYSPNERHMPSYAGEDALIRFGKDPADYGPWVGDDIAVGNVTQHMVERGEACGLSFWRGSTAELPTKPAGPGSERLPGGIGALDYEAMSAYLSRLRAYLYTGTVAAPYTLGLIEAMLSGVPVVSISPRAWAGPDALFEGADLAGVVADREYIAANLLRPILDEFDSLAADISERQRRRAVELFSYDVVGPQWQAFLS